VLGCVVSYLMACSAGSASSINGFDVSGVFISCWFAWIAFLPDNEVFTAVK
jgi:hypothetical protein